MKFNRLFFSLPLCLILTNCQSLSDQIKSAFNTVDNSLITTNGIYRYSIDSLYSVINYNRQKNESLASKADLIYYTYQDAFKFMDSLKQVLQGKDASGSNVYLATELLVNTTTGDSLTNKIFKVYEYSHSSLYDNKNKLSLDSSLSSFKNIKIGKEWIRKYFEKTPTVAAITTLSKLQNDCLSGVVIVFEDIKHRLSQ